MKKTDYDGKCATSRCFSNVIYHDEGISDENTILSKLFGALGICVEKCWEYPRVLELVSLGRSELSCQHLRAEILKHIRTLHTWLGIHEFPKLQIVFEHSSGRMAISRTKMGYGPHT